MDVLLSRFRNLTVLLVTVVAQLLYLGYQVKTNRDERLIRVWAVTAVTPMAGVVETLRQNTIGFLQDYFILLDVRDQNRKLKSTNDRLQMENNFYRNQLVTAEHARALVQFQSQTPSKTIAARVIGNSTVTTSKAVFIDRGSTSGVEKGMAVVVPAGIVGKVVAVYPLVSQVLLVTDATFKVGVESQKGRVHGILDCGSGKCVVEQIQNEDKVGPGEWFYTSGEDRIFPKGFPVGSVLSSQPGQGMRDVKLNLSGTPEAIDEVLVVLHGVHEAIPATPPVDQLTVKVLPPPPPEIGASAPVTAKPQTEADKVMQRYGDLGKEQGHVYGALGSGIPNFNAKPAATTSYATNAPAIGKPAPSISETAPIPSTGPSNPVAVPPVKPVVTPSSTLPLGAPKHKSTAAAPSKPKAPPPPKATNSGTESTGTEQ